MSQTCYFFHDLNEVDKFTRAEHCLRTFKLLIITWNEFRVNRVAFKSFRGITSCN